MAETTMDDKLRDMPVGRLLVELAIPAIAAQLVALVYNFVDRLFIGQLPSSEMAIASIGICAPLGMIINGVANLFGRSGAPLASIEMGRGRVDRAERYLGTCTTMLLATGLALTAVLSLALEPILVLFGASEATLPGALDYGRIYCAGTLFVHMAIGMNNFIMCQGFSRISMGTTLLGAGLNIVLDPLFIFVLDMGVAGAAAATLISQAASLAWVAAFFAGRKTELRVRRRNLVPDPALARKCVVVGLAPCFMASSEGLLQICFNRQLLFYGGDAAVSAMTIVFSLGSIAFVPRMGLSQGGQPIVSHAFGAGDYARAREAIRLLFVSVSAVTFVSAALLFALPAQLVAIFNPSGSLVGLAVPMLLAYAAGGAVLSVFVVCQSTYLSLGEGRQSFTFAFLRKVVLLIPLMYLLPVVLPIDPVLAVVLAEPASDLAAVVLNIGFFRRFLDRKLPV